MPDMTVSKLAVQARKMFSQRKWQQAYRLWLEAAKRSPDNVSVMVGQVECLQQLNRLDIAEKIIDAAKMRYPNNPQVVFRYAHMASLKADWPEAFERWTETLRQQPHNPSAHIGLGVTLRELGRFDQADDLLSSAIEAFPDALYCYVNHAWTATRRRDWEEALRRWEAVREKFGESDLYVRGRGIVLASMGMDTLDTEIEGRSSDTSESPSAPEQVHGEYDDRKLLFNRFQSLAEDCEFGFVQRHAGLEPLGLFRWAGAPAAQMLPMVRSGLEGIGEDANTELYVEQSGEFWVRDTRYGLRTHTFVFQTAVTGDQVETFRRKMVKRFRFLKDKALEDFASADKIFVVKAETSEITDELVDAIYDAMAVYGASWVLHVKKSRRPTEIGRVERVRDRLIVGHVDARVAIDHEGWKCVCLGALGIRALHESVSP